MQINWNNWNQGGKVIFAASCVAVLSMLMAWVDIGIASQSGLAQGTVLFLGLWYYPAIKVLKNEAIDNKIGLVCGALSVLFTIGYISSKSVELMGNSVNAAGSGAYVFLLASIALVVGVHKYVPASSSSSSSPSSDPGPE